ncbi:MAG: gliding motility-associated C-terminal domain-containing protein [Bacteroidota bacterium]|nr:gliding motility-associated C-terminal domain-containing protein [Bacteroidota bacterium]
MKTRFSLQLLFLSSLSILLVGCSKKEDVVSNQCPDAQLSNNVSDPDLYFLQPNGISPNGDGLNDVFFVVARSKSNPQNSPTFTTQRLQVMRSGNSQLVYDNANYRNNFDGHDSAGKELLEGDYLYELNLDNYSLRGSLKIVRTSKACLCRVVDLNDPILESTACK